MCIRQPRSPRYGKRTAEYCMKAAEEDEVAEGRDQLFSYIEAKQNKSANVVKAAWPYSSGG